MSAAVLEPPPSTASAAGEDSADGSMPQELEANLPILTEKEVELARMLLAEGQEHLFAGWSGPGVEDASKHRFFEQVSRLHSSYAGGGLDSYIRNARKLLADSKEGANPFDGYTPSVPDGERLQFGTPLFDEFEEAGVRAAKDAAFVLVAGGLGERLGFSGIKLALPRETTTGECFLQHYIQSILALQAASLEREAAAPGTVRRIPLVIMTSDDTHAATAELVQRNKLFGMAEGQLLLLKQEKVACLADNDARLAVDGSDRYRIQTKPHGHGDVHSVLFTSGVLEDWRREGRKWVLFFQDTNGLLFKAIPSALGVSRLRDMDVNSLAVPRKAKEAIGGITRLTHADGRTMVLNVEYNQLDPLLRSSGHPDGDVNDETGYSPFPGNINQLVFKLGPYLQELERTQGRVPEFVNPKYTDFTKAAFKSPTRLECMMQDFPKSLPPTTRVGFTVLDVWLAYSPVKNNAADAAAKLLSGTPPHSATSGELAVYAANARMLQQAGAEIGGPLPAVFNGQEASVWPRIVWEPRWAVTFADVRRRVGGGGRVRVAAGSTLVLKGRGITLASLDLEGALVVEAEEGVEAVVRDVVEKNAGWELVALPSADDPSVPEEIRIRGFRMERKEQKVLQFREKTAAL